MKHSQEKIDEVRRLLSTSVLSYNAIASKLGVGRNLVGRISRGKHRCVEIKKKPVEHVGPIERCPGCGVMVEMPCLECRMASIKERDKL